MKFLINFIDGIVQDIYRQIMIGRRLHLEVFTCGHWEVKDGKVVDLIFVPLKYRVGKNFIKYKIKWDDGDEVIHWAFAYKKNDKGVYQWRT